MTAAVYRVEHETSYVHSGRVLTSQHVACLTPRTLPSQTVRSHELVVEPAPASRAQRVDYFGNAVDQFTILTPYKKMRVVGRSVVEVRSSALSVTAEASGDPGVVIDNDARFGHSVPWETVRDALVYQRGSPYVDTVELSYPSPYIATGPELAAYARESFATDRPLVAAAVDLMRRINQEFIFDADATTIATPVLQVLTNRRGVCQDFPHLQVGCLRSLGLPARYVSGYLVTHPVPGQPRLVGADASHAWLSVWCPRLGWVDLDPTNDVLPSQRHVTVAWGRDYGDVSPLRGILLGGHDHRLKVAVTVTPLGDATAL
ncbi:MAG: transglutaminase family protein [Vicinamibacterales bacterium]